MAWIPSGLGIDILHTLPYFKVSNGETQPGVILIRPRNMRDHHLVRALKRTLFLKEIHKIVLNMNFYEIKVNDPRIIIVFENIYFGFPSTNNGREVEISGIVLPLSNPFTSEFLKPNHFFLGKNLFELRDKIFFK